MKFQTNLAKLIYVRISTLYTMSSNRPKPILCIGQRLVRIIDICK